jgi:hypothetical protein
MAENPSLKYPRTLRLPLVNIEGKRVLGESETEKLFRGKVVVEEKMDGRTADFTAERYHIFAEDLRRQHSIFYKLPGRYAVFDVFDYQRGLFVIADEKLEIARDLRSGKLRVKDVDPILFFPIPRIATGNFTMEQIPPLVGISAYAYDKAKKQPACMEGVVVKPCRDLFEEEFVTGKLIRTEFREGIEVHYLNQPYRPNAINPKVQVVEFLSTNPCPSKATG